MRDKIVSRQASKFFMGPEVELFGVLDHWSFGAPRLVVRSGQRLPLHGSDFVETFSIVVGFEPTTKRWHQTVTIAISVMNRLNDRSMFGSPSNVKDRISAHWSIGHRIPSIVSPLNVLRPVNRHNFPSVLGVVFRNVPAIRLTPRPKRLFLLRRFRRTVRNGQGSQLVLHTPREGREGTHRRRLLLDRTET